MTGVAAAIAAASIALVEGTDAVGVESSSRGRRGFAAAAVVRTAKALIVLLLLLLLLLL